MSFQDVPWTSDWDVPGTSDRDVPGKVKQDVQGRPGDVGRGRPRDVLGTNICRLGSIPTKILHLVKDQISKHLATTSNLSFSTGIFPTILKTAKVIPIHKENSKLEVSNYRPISDLFSVPQGSVLGPLLFLIFINGLNIAIKHSETFHFAHNTSLLNIRDSVKQMKKLSIRT